MRFDFFVFCFRFRLLFTGFLRSCSFVVFICVFVFFFCQIIYDSATHVPKFLTPHFLIDFIVFGCHVGLFFIKYKYNICIKTLIYDSKKTIDRTNVQLLYTTYSSTPYNAWVSTRECAIDKTFWTTFLWNSEAKANLSILVIVFRKFDNNETKIFLCCVRLCIFCVIFKQYSKGMHGWITKAAKQKS